jgi:hypothetical protein
MNKLQHLRAVKDFISKTVSHRRNLLNNKQSRRPETPELATAMFDLNYRKANIKDFDIMMRFIGLKKTRDMIFKIIPSNKQAWRDEFDRLVQQGKALQGKTVREKQLQINI